jgi:hypothetical protein
MTFFLALLAFVFYRATNLTDAFVIYRGIFSLDLLKEGAVAIQSLLLHPGARLAGSAVLDMKHCLGIFVLIIAADIVARRKFSFVNLPAPVQIAIVNVAVLLVLSSWIMGRGNQPFVYYKF